MLHITTDMFDRLKAHRGLVGTFCTTKSVFNRKYKGKTKKGRFTEILADFSTGSFAVVEMSILSYKKTEIQIIQCNDKGEEKIKRELGVSISIACNLITDTSGTDGIAELEDYIMDLSDIPNI